MADDKEKLTALQDGLASFKENYAQSDLARRVISLVEEMVSFEIGEAQDNVEWKRWVL